jgi:flagellar biosynthesis/type III secretory pathway chaperone
MEKILSELYLQLQKLLTLHRQLLDLLRAERQALVDADPAKIEELALSKQGLLDQIALADESRRKLVSSVAAAARLPAETVALSRVAIVAQGLQVKLGEQFRSVQQALSHILTKVEEQGAYNRALVEQSLERLVQMKRNIVGSEAPKSGTYSASGQQAAPGSGARLISREA